MPFISFTWLTALAKTSSIMLNRSGKSGYLCLVLDLGGKAFIFPPTDYDVSCGLFIYGLYCIEVSSSYTYFVESFYNAFSASIEMIMWFLSFILLMWCIISIDLHMLKHPYIPGINPNCSWCIILSMCCWIQFASILLKIFAFLFIRDIGL